MKAPTILWFRQDLRLSDNPALKAAIERGAPVLPLYILDDETPGPWRPGGASRWWLHHSLSALSDWLRALGAPLVLRRGPADRVLEELIQEIGATAVYWNRCYEPSAVRRDRAIKASLEKKGLVVKSFNASLLAEPWEVKTKAGEPYRVFTPFWRAASGRLNLTRPLSAPASLPAVETGLRSDDLESWALLPCAPDWAAEFEDLWTPGEEGAQLRLTEFLDEGLAHYASGRDRPAESNTSRLSPHLHWGEISPRQVWSALDHAEADGRNVETYRSELGWREFSYHLLFQAPELPDRNLRAEFDAFPWAEDETVLQAWQQGRTGYPIVDAGMRELWESGWMHNRVRMIAASFLVKHLLQPWQAGARWFWDTLVDADLASNSASWQWVAGCGADAAPYFRIFNPVLQGEKFDPEGTYVRKWLPELQDLPNSHIHKPWELAEPPQSYPQPIIDLSAGRRRALEAYETIKGARGQSA